MIIAETIVYFLAAYFAAGALFALYFVIFRIVDFDEAAKGTGAGFRLIIFFGAAALWVVLLARLIKGGGIPPEKNAHLRGGKQ